MSEEINEIGEDGLKYYRKYLKFGDILENGWASCRNPTRLGIVVKLKSKMINMTDMEGHFWDLNFDKQTKIKYHGNIIPLNDRYQRIKTKINNGKETNT